jgi:nicotinamidase-related amidase
MAAGGEAGLDVIPEASGVIPEASGVGSRLHRWRIEDREYARHEERRGRRYAFETLEPGRTALVVIDMVPFLVAESSYCLGIVPNITRLAEVLRVAGGTVAWVVPGAGEPMAASAFFPGRCPLSGWLTERVVDTVLITGTVTNVCCESSARDASTLGYRVIMVADANAARRDEDHNATLHTIYRSFGDVRPAADVIGLIETGAR